ncbi:MAG: lysophospholipid acyltransferase family protein [Candidatus Hodarchaeales archaeon]|jgi:1-acyl-sn-glycerol-3-phosphate acyltransferase
MNLESHYKVTKWGFPRRALFRTIQSLISIVIRNFFQFEVHGIENIKDFPEGRPVIFAANHRSHLDALVFGTAVTPIRRYFATIAPGNVMRENKLFGFTRYIGAYPLDKDDPEPALHYFLKTLENNLSIIIFPQGGRLARTPFHDFMSFTQEGRTGVGRLILRTGGKIPVIPCYMHGTAETLSRGQLLPRFGTYLSVSFGKPIYFDKYVKRKSSEENEEFFDVARDITYSVMKNIQELLYSTEKGYFSLLEKIFSKNLHDIKLSEVQEKKLRYFTKNISHVNPDDLTKLLL